MNFTKFLFKRSAVFFFVYEALQILYRNYLFFSSKIEDGLLAGLFKVNILGLLHDINAFLYFMIGYSVYLLLIPTSWYGKKTDKIISLFIFFIFTFLFCFNVVAEHFFWEEFTSRYNFIAVDYLVYTNEVIGNIRESYNLPVYLSAILVVSIIIFMLTKKCLFPEPKTGFSVFNRFAGIVSVILLLVVFDNGSEFVSSKFQAREDQFVLEEISRNGVKSLFQAFWNNEINYEKFYITKDKNEIYKNIRALLNEDDMGVKFTSDDPKDLTRKIERVGEELHKNVIIITMESMSLSFMKKGGNEENLTPNLDKLADEGIFFTQAYATGTRTVRGLEAITLSVPPTPGQSILRRKHNEQLFSLGYIFKDRDYDVKFIYGGYGYFDNMNYFFSNNGYDVIDRSTFAKDEIHFANVWGVSDEDLFDKVISESDKSFAANKKFFNMVMTTSNHRPYTYPDGKIDIPSGTKSRAGGVKYADYSVGQLIEKAKQKPWFKDTIFVFVADHTHGSSGKTELSINKYHIPIIFYSPGFIQPQKVDNLTSQIDIAPMLLGELNFSYYTKFFGEDILRDKDEQSHVFVSNYQKVALLKQDKIIILKPKKLFDIFVHDEIKSENVPDDGKESSEDQKLLSDAVSYYQSASFWAENQKKLPTTIVKK